MPHLVPVLAECLALHGVEGPQLFLALHWLKGISLGLLGTELIQTCMCMSPCEHFPSSGINAQECNLLRWVTAVCYVAFPAGSFRMAMPLNIHRHQHRDRLCAPASGAVTALHVSPRAGQVLICRQHLFTSVFHFLPGLSAFILVRFETLWSANIFSGL